MTQPQHEGKRLSEAEQLKRAHLPLSTSAIHGLMRLRSVKRYEMLADSLQAYHLNVETQINILTVKLTSAEAKVKHLQKSLGMAWGTAIEGWLDDYGRYRDYPDGDPMKEFYRDLLNKIANALEKQQALSPEPLVERGEQG